MQYEAGARLRQSCSDILGGFGCRYKAIQRKLILRQKSCRKFNILNWNENPPGPVLPPWPEKPPTPPPPPPPKPIPPNINSSKGAISYGRLFGPFGVFDQSWIKHGNLPFVQFSSLDLVTWTQNTANLIHVFSTHIHWWHLQIKKDFVVQNTSFLPSMTSNMELSSRWIIILRSSRRYC